MKKLSILSIRKKEQLSIIETFFVILTFLIKISDANHLISYQQQQAAAAAASNRILSTTTTNSQQQQFHNNNNNNQANLLSSSLESSFSQTTIPIITPFNFDQNVQENQRSSVLCTISSGELPVSINWLKDGQLLTPQIAQAKKIIIKPDLDQSTLKFTSVRLDHSGNYTCVAKNKAGIQAHSAQLIVHAEPRWIREPLNEPIVTTKGQTIVIDCQSIGWPKPQQSWQIKTHFQNEFENLNPSPNGRISFASNGSLIIRNADKSDEANYLCKSSNGIGKGISWSTSLKVTVPAHFEHTNRQQINVIRKQNPIQLRCDAYGDEPITIEWFKNKQRLNNDLDPRFSIHNEPLGNRLISILVIKSTQRQDNSIYECVTRNPVGRDRQLIELLVQEEPDSLQEISVEKIDSRSIQLNFTEPYDGKSSITNYMFQYKKVLPQQQHQQQLDSLSYPANELSTSSSSELSYAQQQQQQQQQQDISALVYNSDIISSPSSSSSLNVISSNSKLLSTTTTLNSNDDWQQANRIMLPIQAGLINNGNTRLITIDKLEPSTKYAVRGLAMNAIGQSKFSQLIEFTTDEEAPDLRPTNIRAQAINSTSILVSWDELQRNKLNSRIHGYYIGYRNASSLNLFNNNSINNNNNNYKYKPYLISEQESLINFNNNNNNNNNQLQRLEFILQDLDRDTIYELIVVAFNARGSGPNSESIICKTNEMDAPKPVKLSIRNESSDSIFIEWQKDPFDQNPIDDYVLYQEKNSGSQESLQIRFPGNQTQYKASGLKCGTRYQFYIIAHNKVGKSLPSEVVGALTTGSLPIIPSKTSLLKMINSTCLLVDLDSFQDDNCRIKTFTVRYKIEKTSQLLNHQQQHHHHLHHHPHHHQNNILVNNNNNLALTNSLGNNNNNNKQIISSTTSSSSSSSSTSQATAAAAAAASSSSSSTNQQAITSVAAASSTLSGEWTTINPKSNIKHQRANDEDRMEYLCNLNPIGEYTIHVSALNDVGRSEIEYSVLMSSDELRSSIFKDIGQLLSMTMFTTNIFSNIPSIIVFLIAALFGSLAVIIFHTTLKKYYQKIIILRNQFRATNRAKQDEKRRRKLMNNSNSSSSGNRNNNNNQKLDLWADEYEEEDGDLDDQDQDAYDEDNNLELAGADGDDEDDTIVGQGREGIDCLLDDNSSSSGGETITTTTTTSSSRGSGALMGRQNNKNLLNKKQQHLHRRQLSTQTISAAHLQQQQQQHHFATQRRPPATINRNKISPTGHYISNISDSAFYKPSPLLLHDSQTTIGNGKQCFNNNCSTSISTASTDSIHGRFQCLNSRQYPKMNEYTMLPTISASLNQTRPIESSTLANDIYGTTTGRPSPQQHQLIAAHSLTNSPVTNNSIHYSTLRRSSMQTYLPHQAKIKGGRAQQQQQQQINSTNSNNRQNQSQNIADIYGYYMAPSQMNSNDNSNQHHSYQHHNPHHQHQLLHHQSFQQQQQQQQHLTSANDEAANSILVLPQQIIYSAPNIRRQPVFL